MANLSLRCFAFALFVVSFTPLLVCAGSSGYEQDVRHLNLAHGRVVFTDKCMNCHETGEQGAPILGNDEEWDARLAKPLSALIKNAQEGHDDMPPKGGLELTDQEVASAVAYVVYNSRSAPKSRLSRLLPKTSAGDTDHTRSADLATCPTGETLEHCVVEIPAHDVVFNMFLMLIGKERWK